MKVSVIPLRRLPTHFFTLDYDTADLLIVPGMLVEIPFRSKKILGVVYEISVESPTSTTPPLKKILQILNETPLLNATTLKLFRDFHELHGGPSSVNLELFLPPLLKRRLRKLHLPAMTGQSNLLPGNITVFRYHAEEERQQFLKDQTRGAKRRDQILLVVPQIIETKKLAKNLDALPYHSQMTSAERFEVWEKAANGAPLIVGTRIALFLPWQKLKTIIVDKEQDESHDNWDQHPRYRGREVALLLSKHLGSRVIFSSYSLAVETALFAEKKKWRSEIAIFPPPLPATIINMRDDRDRKNFSPLSLTAENEIRNANGVFILASRTGLFHHVSCRDCAAALQCESCGQMLTLYRDRNLICHACSRVKSMPAVCANCQGANFRQYGAGLEAIQDQLAKKFPERHNIFVGTTVASPEIEWMLIEKIIIADPDIFFHLPDYRGLERLWHKIQELRFLAPSAAIHIQTDHPDHPFWRALTTAPANFYNREWRARQNFLYPPFSLLLELFTATASQSEGLKEAQHVRKMATNHADSKNVSDPQILPTSRKERAVKIQITVKLVGKNRAEARRRIIDELPEKWYALSR
ncbi:MAG: primosomal protein N' [Candidatus Magasanikbacteria bacterium]|nr:primosomal protein N' [Candidatus Magasanikbacteria bacterium]